MPESVTIPRPTSVVPCAPTRDHPTIVMLPEDVLAHACALPFADALVYVWDCLLTACGQPMLKDATGPIVPGAYQIPREHSARFLNAWMQAAPVDQRAGIGMTWVNVGPSSLPD